MSLLLWLALSCLPVDATADLDGDGSTAGDDCDDLDASVFPIAPELCDGRDHDCDGVVDSPAPDAVPTWHADLDADGYGSIDDTVVACAAPTGWLASGGDCDDADPLVHPDAPEWCATPDVDDDCDGKADEDAAIDASTWYADSDDDGWGDPETTAVACAMPAGHVANDGDCDDTAVDVSPDADETCNAVDDDCDGATDEDAIEAPAWFPDGDEDGHGASSAATYACMAPAGLIASHDDCDDTDTNVSPEGTEVCGGGDEDCDGEVDEGSTQEAPVWYLDADGDGLGTPDAPVSSCVAPPLHVGAAGDCDDTNPLIGGC